MLVWRQRKRSVITERLHYMRKLGRIKIDGDLDAIRAGAADYESVSYVVTNGSAEDVAAMFEHAGDGICAITDEGLCSGMPKWQRLRQLLDIIPMSCLSRLQSAIAGRAATASSKVLTARAVVGSRV